VAAEVGAAIGVVADVAAATGVVAVVAPAIGVVAAVAIPDGLVANGAVVGIAAGVVEHAAITKVAAIGRTKDLVKRIFSPSIIGVTIERRRPAGPNRLVPVASLTRGQLPTPRSGNALIAGQILASVPSAPRYA
jgi:hypothetical protein